MKRASLLQFVKFGIVGLSNTLIAYAVYAACVWLGCHYLVANGLGFVVGVLNAYYWSDRYVFKKGEGETRSALWTLVKTRPIWPMVPPVCCWQASSSTSMSIGGRSQPIWPSCWCWS